MFLLHLLAHFMRFKDLVCTLQHLSKHLERETMPQPTKYPNNVVWKALEYKRQFSGVFLPKVSHYITVRAWSRGFVPNKFTVVALFPFGAELLLRHGDWDQASKTCLTKEKDKMMLKFV